MVYASDYFTTNKKELLREGNVDLDLQQVHHEMRKSLKLFGKVPSAHVLLR